MHQEIVRHKLNTDKELGINMGRIFQAISLGVVAVLIAAPLLLLWNAYFPPPVGVVKVENDNKVKKDTKFIKAGQCNCCDACNCKPCDDDVAILKHVQEVRDGSVGLLISIAHTPNSPSLRTLSIDTGTPWLTSEVGFIHITVRDGAEAKRLRDLVLKSVLDARWQAQ